MDRFDDDGGHDGELDYDFDSPSVSFYLLDRTDFESVNRLVNEIAIQFSREFRNRTAVLLCEHKPLITIGRRGSWGHLLDPSQGTRTDPVLVKWVARSGGCIVHGPGQLAAYFVSSQAPEQAAATKFRLRVHQGVIGFLSELGLSIRRADPNVGIWSRLGAVLAYGWRESESVTHHGFYLNVHPVDGSRSHVRFVPPSDEMAGSAARMSSLLAEQRQPVRMAQVRSVLLPHLAKSLGCERYHIFTGHPHLARVRVHEP